jgi:glycosyltransferase 2 family protein
MNPTTKRWLVRGVKLALAALLLFFVGRQFLSDLLNPELYKIEPDPAWLVASAAFYLISLLPSMLYWRHLHFKFGYPIPFYAGFRAHYIAQLGKYVPGKALAIAIRADMMHPFGVPYGVSIIITFYEVLTAMAAAGMVAALIYVFDPPEKSRELLHELGIEVHPSLLGLILVAMCGLPLVPGVFNFVITKLTSKLQAIELYRLPPVQIRTLSIGLLATGAGWWMQGLGVWAMFVAVAPTAPGLTFSWWAQVTAAVAFANVAGFVIVFIPAGFGIRESLLKNLLSAPGVDSVHITAAVLLLRLDWIIAEMLVGAFLYILTPREERSDSQGLQKSAASLPEGEGSNVA